MPCSFPFTAAAAAAASLASPARCPASPDGSFCAPQHLHRAGTEGRLHQEGCSVNTWSTQVTGAPRLATKSARFGHHSWCVMMQDVL